MSIRCPNCEDFHSEETITMNNGLCPTCNCTVVYDLHYDTDTEQSYGWEDLQVLIPESYGTPARQLNLFPIKE